jgi:hypothetical protein
LGIALVAGTLSQPAFAQNPQPTIPTPYGAARTPPEPLPIGACPPPQPNLVPGPLTPDKAPPGPADCLSINPSAPGAFQCENYATDCNIFFDVGAQALQRQKLGRGVIALRDNDNPTPDVKIGTVPSPLSPPALEFNDISPNMAWGPRMTVGVLAGTDIVEVTGFFIPNNSHTQTNDFPGRIFAFFINAPDGFQGTNGLFTQADRISLTLQNQVGNAELNYRYSNLGLGGCELIVGVRYFDVFERLTTTVDQNADLAPLNPVLHTSNPAFVASYTAGTHNRIVAPQLGFEGNWGCESWGSCFSWLSIGCLAKGAWGVNFVTDTHTLVRGDQFPGFNVERSDTIFSQMYEIGGFLEIHMTERCKVRAGYNAIWALNIDAVVDQYNFDLAKPQGKENHDGSVLYHGPMIELQFLF